MMTRYLTFRSGRFPIPQTEEEEKTGEALAWHIADAVKSAGLECISKAPVYGEGGWTFRFAIDGQRVNIFLNVASLSSLPQDAWCIALIPRSKGLFRKPKAIPKAIEKLIQGSVDRAEATGLTWWDEDEFQTNI